MAKQKSYEEIFGAGINDRISSMGEQHLACALLLDVSGSMGVGAKPNRPIDKLNEALNRFKASVCSDPIAAKRVDISIVTFSNNAEVISDFVPVTEMPTPKLEANGITETAEGIQVAIDLVKERTHMYQQLGTPCHKPWIFMITDGLSTSDSKELQEAAQRIEYEENHGTHGKLTFWALGVEGYDKDELFSLTRRVMELKNQDFDGVFDWLSESMSCISQSQVGDRVSLTPLPETMERVIPDDWY